MNAEQAFAHTIIRAGSVVGLIGAGAADAADSHAGDIATPGASCIAITDGRIVAIGGGEVSAQFTGPDTVVLDFPGAAVLPGLVDTHTHPVWGSESQGGSVGLARAVTLDLLRETLAAEIAARPEGTWISGFGLDIDVFPGDPTGRIFDEWFPGVTISLMTRDAHALVVSPAVIAAAGITGAETFADASNIVTDKHGPTGWIIELQAMDLVFAHYPEAPLEVQAGYLQDALRTFASQGLTAIHALDFHDPSNELYRMIEAERELPVRVRCSPLVPADSPRSEWERIAALIGTGGRRWHVISVKFMLDGTADNGTAWFEEPDTLGENDAALWKDTDAYREAVRFFTERNIATVTHAIGDRAVRFVLDTVAEVGHPASGPHRIEHIESIPDVLLDRFAELGVVAGLQPTHGTRLVSPDQSDSWSRRIGPDRVARGWRIHDLIDHGATVTLSSDWPIGVGDPRVSLADAQLRRPVDEAGRGLNQPGQRIDAATAYAAMTAAPAVAEGSQHEHGRIAGGYVADLTVFAANPLTLTPEAQATNPVLATFIDGLRVDVTAEKAPVLTDA